VPLQLLPKEINGVRIIGIDVPGFGVPTHAEAKDVLAGAMLAYARSRGGAGPVAAPEHAHDKPTVTLLGEMFPADPVIIGRCWSRSASPPAPVVPTREWRELYAALDCAVVAAIHPFYTASVREFEAGRPQRRRLRARGHDGTAAWLDAIGALRRRRATRIGAKIACSRIARARALPIRAGSRSGYEGRSCSSPALLGRERRRRVATSARLPRTPWSDPDASGWSQGVHVQYRASLSRTRGASTFAPTSPSARRRCAEAKEQRIPALYFTT
jgi:chlorophyllide a reductase subunit Y